MNVASGFAVRPPITRTSRHLSWQYPGFSHGPRNPSCEWRQRMVKHDEILTFHCFGNIKRMVRNVNESKRSREALYCTRPKGPMTLDLRSIHWPINLLRLYRDLVLMLNRTGLCSLGVLSMSTMVRDAKKIPSLVTTSCWHMARFQLGNRFMVSTLAEIPPVP